MDSLHQLETIILLLIAVLARTTVARTLVIPYPILLVIGGLILGLIPGLPTIRLAPDLGSCISSVRINSQLGNVEEASLRRPALFRARTAW
jgi:NhaP-type Na+/H+ or K+/H+ antiporter